MTKRFEPSANLLPSRRVDSGDRRLRVVVCGADGVGASKLTDTLLALPRVTVVRRRSAPGLDGLLGSEELRALELDVAVLVVDAARDLDSRIKRESYLIGLLRVPHVVVAVDQLDTVADAESAFAAAVARLGEFAERIALKIDAFVPLAFPPDTNIQGASPRMSWHRGPTLVQALEAAAPVVQPAFRLVVEEGADPVGSGGASPSGVVASGHIRPGGLIRVWPSGEESRVVRLIYEGRESEGAGPGDRVRLELEPDVTVRQGDVIADADAPPQVGRQFEAVVVWQHREPMLPGRSYLLQVGARREPANVTPLKYKMDVASLQQVAAEKLEAGEIGTCEVEFDRPIVFEPFADNRVLGRFAVLDRLTNEPIGAGFLRFALRRSQTVYWQALEVSKPVRAQQKRQKACVIWLTGLSGAGKSTIANLVEKKLVALGCHTYLLDGDNVRHGLNKDLGFTAQDRVENIRRVAEVAKLMVDAGLMVLVSFISPFRAERRMARDLLEPGEMIEVFVDTPLAVAEGRDPKGLYKKARKGELKNFTGIDSPYEVPLNPEIRIDTTMTASAAAADQVIDYLMRAKAVSVP
jgi:bifunctional enzyme CysN/CysC